MPNLLRQWRTSHGWTLDEARGLTGVSISHLSRVELGERQPTPQVKVRIARGLGARVSELFPVERQADA